MIMRQKRSVILFLLLAALLLALAACGSRRDSAGGSQDIVFPDITPVYGDPVEAAPEETESPKVTDSPVDGQVPATAQQATPADKAKIAGSFVGRPVGELLDALGGPVNSVYTPSANGLGEDGELQYEGFSVDTYRENGQETVSGVRLS